MWEIELRYHIGKLLPHTVSKRLSLRNLSQSQPTAPEDAVATAFNYKGWGEYASIRPMQCEKEIVEFAKVVRDLEPDTVVEIGTAKGGSLFILAQMAPTAHIISVDLPPEEATKPQTPPSFQSTFGDEISYDAVRSDSHDAETRNQVENLSGGEIDLLFIDGDHSETSVRHDFMQYAPLVRDGGLIAFHDIEYEQGGVDAIWDELNLSNRYSTSEIVFSEERIARTARVGIGIAQVERTKRS